MGSSKFNRCNDKSSKIYFLNIARRWIVIEYYLFRVENNILILQQLDFFGRTSELAKLFGIQFYEVLSRGSQVGEELIFPVIYFIFNKLSNSSFFSFASSQ